MCGQEKVLSLAKLAKNQEKTKPQEAAKNYLEAAALLIDLSAKNPEKEDEYVGVANKLYKKAKRLKNEQEKGTSTTTPSTSDTITFDTIGGLEELKEEIRFKIIEPLRNPDLFKFYNKSMGGGILMYGPPGCGKTLIAKATANESKTTFIHVKSSDLRSKYVGETEQNIAQLFEDARKSQPVIIFFDEFEALGADRSESLSHERSAVAQLLTEMDGVDAKDQQILLLAATNEPWSIDPALRREGRFGSSIFIPPPDHESRKQIIKLEMSSRPMKDLDVELLARLTTHFSGADIKAMCEQATDIPLKESLQTGKRRKITMDDMNLAISRSQSIIKPWFAKAREQVIKKKIETSFKDLIEKANELVRIKEVVVA